MPEHAPGSAWPEVRVAASAANLDEREAWLLAAGAVSVTYQEPEESVAPILEPLPGETPLWASMRLVGLFEQGLPDAGLRLALQRAASSVGIVLPDYELARLADEAWERSWMDGFQPMQFGPRFWICPNHAEAPDRDAVTLWLDPGLAFGTGTHPTTAQCLSWLSADTGKELAPLQGKRVVDYGCGSGVLAIAAALLGASEVLAIDIDEQALLATAQNAEVNGVARVIATALPEAADGGPADLILANILYLPLVALAGELTSRIRTGGRLIMAGMLEAQVEPLLQAYAPAFSIHQAGAIDGWALLVGVRLESLPASSGLGA